jgi:hypothetical protein
VQTTPPPARFERAAQSDRKDRNWGNRDRGRGGDRVAGMGDHLPDFIALSFDERRGGPPRPFTPDEDDSADEQTPAVAENTTEASQTTAVTSDADAEAPKPKRRRRKKTEIAASAPESSEAGAA